MQVVRVRILSHLVRRGVIEVGPELTVLNDGFAEREPALAQLAAASVAGLPPAGPELRRRPDPVALRGHPGVEITAPLSVTEMGFSLHAATRAGAEDARAREALCKYILRPPLSQERLHLLPDGLVRIELRKPYRDGTYAVDMDPLSLLCRLATSIPPPRRHTVHYGGVLAPASKIRHEIVPPPPPVPAGQEAPTNPRPPTHRSIYRPWCELLKRAFAEDVEKCAKCRGDSPRKSVVGGPGRMKLKALVQKPENIARFLKHLGEPTEPPPLAPARAPPYWQARELRHRPQAQTELFDA